MARGANAARPVLRCWLVAAKCSNSAALPGRAGGESLGLVGAGCDVILLHYGAPSSCRHVPSVAGPFAFITAAFGIEAAGACRRAHRAGLGRGVRWVAVNDRHRAAIAVPRATCRSAAAGILPCIFSSGVVETGSLTAIVGPNGAGKSTLFKGVVGTLKPLAGSIARNGSDPRAIAYLPQAAEIDRSFPINVCSSRWRWGFGGAKACSWATSTARITQRIEAGLAAVGLTGFEQRSIGAMSGRRVRACCSPGFWSRGRASDRARRASSAPSTAKTVADLMHLVRQWHWGNAPCKRPPPDRELVRASVPRCSFARPARRSSLGRNARGADCGGSRSRAPHVRGVRRGRRGVRRRGRVIPNHPPPRSGEDPHWLGGKGLGLLK